MKKLAYIAVITFALLVTLASTPAAAQIGGAFAQHDAVISAEIPFAFEVAGARLEAGEYTVTPQVHSPALLIRRKGGGQVAVALCWKAQDMGERPSYGRLVFHKYGDQYFFASAWAGDEGKQVSQSKRERRLRKELLKGGVAGKAGAGPEVVMIAALARQVR
jgi:hypothetical protein